MQKSALERIMAELQERIDLKQVVCIEQIGEITYQITLKTGGPYSPLSRATVSPCTCSRRWGDGQ